MAKSHQKGQIVRNKIRLTAIEQLPSNHEKISLILGYGTLAPSTHNTQPWRFEIVGTTLKVYIDFTKKIPVADPTGRDMYISLGALLKNIELSSIELGVTCHIQLQQELLGHELVAELRFENLDNARTPAQSAVLDGIVRRQNYRGFFKDSFDKDAFLAVLNQVSKSKSPVIPAFADGKEQIEKLAQLTVQGLREAYATQAFRTEISSFINHNLSRKQYGLHGYSLRLTTPQSFIIPKIMKLKDIGAKLAVLNYKSFVLSPVVMVLTTKTDDEKSWLAVGEMMEEIMVRSTIAGLATSIYSAAIEMPGLRSKVSSVLRLSEQGLPQILFCVGTPGAALPYSVRKKVHLLTN